MPPVTGSKEDSPPTRPLLVALISRQLFGLMTPRLLANLPYRELMDNLRSSLETQCSVAPTISLVPGARLCAPPTKRDVALMQHDRRDSGSAFPN